MLPYISNATSGGDTDHLHLTILSSTLPLLAALSTAPSSVTAATAVLLAFLPK